MHVSKRVLVNLSPQLLVLKFGRCVVRYGYKDIHKDDHKFEDKLIEKLGDFILTEDDVEYESPSCEDGSDGKMQLSVIRSLSLVHAINGDGAPREISSKGKELLGISQVTPFNYLLLCTWLWNV